jgi:hypothetical protein
MVLESRYIAPVRPQKWRKFVMDLSDHGNCASCDRITESSKQTSQHQNLTIAPILEGHCSERYALDVTESYLLDIAKHGLPVAVHVSLFFHHVKRKGKSGEIPERF